MSFSATDFVPLTEFSLASRWSELPEHVRASIRPLRREVAEALRSLANEMDPGEGPDVVKIVADGEAHTVREHLSALGVAVGTEVVVWWPWGAALVPWEMFAAHWDAFCYPSSDDVAVWPEDGSWSLAYDHFDIFRFGRRRSLV